VAHGVAYWLAVVAVSLVLVVALLMLLEARDASELRDAGAGPSGRASALG
jgi:hypothetical protein